MEWIEATVEDHIGYLTLKRKEAANALSQAMLEEITDQLNEWKFDREVRAIIVTGEGDKVFCAGADLKERRGMSEMQVRHAVNKIKTTIKYLEEMPVPVIAAINGSAFGGGLELALACDLRIAAENAQFGLTETSLGIIPGAGGTQRLPRAIGVQRAKEMIYTARRIPADTAYSWGLLLKVVPPNLLLSEARDLALEITKNGPVAVKQAKFAINYGSVTDLETGLVIEEKAYEVTIPTEDRLEGLNAFKEKRKPNYTGK